MTGASCSAIFFNVLIDKSDVELGDLIKKNYYKKSVSNATDKNVMSGRNRANGNVD